MGTAQLNAANHFESPTVSFAGSQRYKYRRPLYRLLVFPLHLLEARSHDADVSHLPQYLVECFIQTRPSITRGLIRFFYCSL